MVLSPPKSAGVWLSFSWLVLTERPWSFAASTIMPWCAPGCSANGVAPPSTGYLVVKFMPSEPSAASDTTLVPAGI